MDGYLYCKQLLENLSILFNECQPNCGHCEKLIEKLSAHIRYSHMVINPHQKDEENDESLTSDDPEPQELVEVKVENEDVEENYLFEDISYEEGEGQQPTTIAESDVDLTINRVVEGQFEIKEKEVKEEDEIEYPFDERDIYDPEYIPPPSPKPKPPRNPKPKYSESEPIIRHVCRVCKSTFPKPTLLFQHFKSDHSEFPKLNPYGCDVCVEKEFSSWDTLKNHIKTSHSNSNAPPKSLDYLCEICSKGFSTQSRLHTHLQIHSEQRPFICIQCGASFKTKPALSFHSKRHAPVKPFVCENCGKGFIDKSKLEIHGRIHSGIKPYSCTICNKRFRVKRSLNDHLKIHAGIKSFMCSQCPKSFVLREQLVNHEKTHSGIRPHKCNICGKGFIQSQHLKRHIQNVHFKGQEQNTNSDLIHDLAPIAFHPLAN